VSHAVGWKQIAELVSQLCGGLVVSPDQARDWARRRGLPAHVVGGRVQATRGEIKAWLATAKLVRRVSVGA